MSPASRSPLPELGGDAALLSFLPLLYVAWADGELTDREIEAIGGPVERLTSLEPRQRARLLAWLAPQAPPSAEELQSLLRAIRWAARGLGEEARSSLAHLGAEMARSSLPEGAEDPVSAEVAGALARLEAALGVAGAEASRQLLVEARPEPPPPDSTRAFDPSALCEVLETPHGAIRERMRRLLAEPRFAYRPELDRAAYREQVLAWCRILAAEGIGALALPRAQGGGDDLGGFIAAFSTLAFHDQSLLVKFGVQFGLFAGAIQHLGTARHHERYLREAATLELPGCFAMSETRHGSNVAELQTMARYDPATREFVVTTPTEGDAKDYIGNAARHGRLAVVFARLEVGDAEHGVHALLVPIRDAAGQPLRGVRIEDCGEKEGLNGVDNGRLWFDHVRVPRENLLDRFAQVSEEGVYTSPIASPSRRFFTMLGTLVGGRISVAAAANNAAKSGLAIALRYAEKRRQFGPAGAAETTLLDYRSHQRRLLPRLAATYAIDFAHRDLVRRYVAKSEADSRQVETWAAGVKAYSSWHNVATLQECREACGGKGYLAENRLGILRADTDVYTTFEGDNTVLMQLVAKGRLTEYRHQFSDLRIGVLLNYLTHRAATALSELNPIVVRNTADEHLLDPAFHRAALAYREERLLRSVAGRLKSRIDAGMDSFAALNECQEHLLRMAEAWVERRVLEAFQEGVAEHREAPYGPSLDRLAALFALSRIERDRGWFLEAGYLESAKSRAVRRMVDRLCLEVRDVALELVDAWGIPDELLAAPIAT
jgi:acyl-CoA oxidase